MKASPSRIAGFALLFLLLAAWELAARTGAVDADHLPAPSTVAAAFFETGVAAELFANMLASLRRILCGWALGGLFGFSLGFLCGHVPRAHSLLEATVEFLRPMPSVALIPIGVLFLGTGDALNIAVIAFACSWPVFVNTVYGVGSVSRVLVNTAGTFGAGRARTIRSVLIPASLPFVLTGLRISLGVAVAVVVITEMAASGTGIGAFILATSLSFRIPQMYAAVILIGVLGYCLNKAFTTAEAKLLAGRPEGKRA